MFDTISIFMSIRNDILRAVSHVESPKTDISIKPMSLKQKYWFYVQNLFYNT